MNCPCKCIVLQLDRVFKSRTRNFAVHKVHQVSSNTSSIHTLVSVLYSRQVNMPESFEVTTKFMPKRKHIIVPNLWCSIDMSYEVEWLSYLFQACPVIIITGITPVSLYHFSLHNFPLSHEAYTDSSISMCPYLQCMYHPRGVGLGNE